MIKVSIIGAGNVASHLYHTFSEAEQLEVVQVFNRNPSHLDFVTNPEQKVSDIKKLTKVDLYIIAIKDEAISDFVSQLPDNKAIYAHCSGSVDLEVLSKFTNHGVFYPLQTFSTNKPVNFREVPVCVEANSEENLELLKRMAGYVSDKVFEVSSSQRRALHLSAVFVNNFANHMYALAAEYCRKHELPFMILQPLIKETAEKVESLPPYSAQTGPAMRNDQKTLSTHLEMLDEDGKKIYSILTESIQKLHGKKL